jgi:hypothetical protein
MTRTITWKERQKETLREYYAKYIPEFENHDDDRRIYCNTYKMLARALEELPEEPEVFTKCAMNKAINQELCMLDRIILRFHYEQVGGA